MIIKEFQERNDVLSKLMPKVQNFAKIPRIGFKQWLKRDNIILVQTTRHLLYYLQNQLKPSSILRRKKTKKKIFTLILWSIR